MWKSTSELGCVDGVGCSKFDSTQVLAARTTATKPLAASNVASPRWRTTGSAKADLLRSVGADPGAVDELAAAAARARARANYGIM